MVPKRTKVAPKTTQIGAAGHQMGAQVPPKTPQVNHMVQKRRPEGSKIQIYQTRPFDISEFVTKMVPKRVQK